MGKMNILRADYVGKLGETYGARQRGKGFVKATPFSHSPHNAEQKASVRAFEKLNRFSSYIAKTFWNYLSLSAKTMSKHNVIAKWLKDIIAEHVFNLSKLTDILYSGTSLKLISFSYDFDAKTATIIYSNSPFSVATQEEVIFIALVDNNGITRDGAVLSSESGSVTLSWQLNDFDYLTLVLFKSSKINNKWLKSNAITEVISMLPVVDGILFTSRLNLTQTPTVENDTITVSAADVSIENETLIFNQ